MVEVGQRPIIAGCYDHIIMNIVVLTGAGISAESGIKTFRDTGGLWENARIEDVATPEAFERNPAMVYEFYNARRQQLFDSNVFPNEAHYALARLAKISAVNLTLVTQNVDNLHERAGSEHIIHMHGELLSVKCAETDEPFVWHSELTHTDVCTCCKPAKPMRPDIVWFGEMPMYMDEIYRALANADLFCAIGTSGAVYPAAGFVDIAHQYGVETVLVNLDELDNGRFNQQILGKASEQVPKWINRVVDDYKLE